MAKRIVKKQLKEQEKSLEKFLKKREIIVSADFQTQIIEPNYNDGGFVSGLKSFFGAIFDNLLEIFLLIVFGGCTIYFIVNEELRTFVMNFLNSLFK